MERKILVVDDDVSVRTLLQDSFSYEGYEVLVAENADQAITVLAKDHADVIFLDLKLFGMNGIDLCRKIRKTNPIAIIYAITGWSALFEIEECREAGFDDYFTKPVNLDMLLKAVDDAFDKLNRWTKRFTGGVESKIKQDER